ncbi:MAG: nucleotidyltransferase [Acidimicrobiaceae bacterium]|nr:nucleotidyltransferase [Acidimicrobiaceae bacterium]MXZ66094.1 nucleotidyltransferase [Acidimicrobiaceae bacterium]MYF33015.1 nucleotidyltransferase [Acidimicrobiaceae bacterium]MYG79670.1 nucleotidyltransferase [Acidimicrobiaceae bacterium]MYJ28666.1 nucleotidyltransferase [Acidimicrobiaceae bacterium]
MSRRERVLGEHREAIRAAAAANKAISIALVGSVARGGDDEPDSDYDFLVTFAKGASLFDLGALQVTLEELLSTEVDVISVGGLKPDESEGHRAMLAEAIPL